ncbi:hypothetical protein BCR34DRAFT_440426, partial [Clohesyomyces aquaticus]
CINKSSSAELTKAINSMFEWYRVSKVCYVYISDFDSEDPDAEFGKSRWFTRGWTLQELIAPFNVRFYDRAWRYFGSKKDLRSKLSHITGIADVAMRNPLMIFTTSVATRMSWAARRQTTRQEDLAYCLLGIFEINMPLIYGEGIRAFKRLQEAIIKSKNDMSIFAWQAPNWLRSTNGSDLLATSPLDFLDCGIIKASRKRSPEFTMTNLGLRIHTELIAVG